MKNLFRIVTVIVGIAGFAPALNAREAVTISVWPALTSSRGSANVKVFVERNDANRWLTWEIDGVEYYRSSSMQLDGAESARSWVFQVHDLPPGQFQVRASVKRANNTEAVAATELTVVPGGPRREP